MKDTLHYLVHDNTNKFKLLKLSVESKGKEKDVSLAERRRRRLRRLIDEASAQGAKLHYKDLSLILLASRATLKRDVKRLRESGRDIRMG